MPHEEDMKDAAVTALEQAETPLEKLKWLLVARGYDGILLFGKMFRRLDDDGNHTLTQEELTEVLKQFGLELTEEEVGEVFSSFDEDGSGSINYNEFLDKLRPEMTEPRVAIVEEAFAKLDESGDGVVTLEDVKGKYDASQHPKVLSEEMTEDEVLLKFIGRFEEGVSEDGKLTKEEFLDYYSCISKSIDDDEYFIAVIKSSWKL